MKSKSRAAALLFVVIDVFGIAIANAQGTLTSEDRQAILAFTFTPQKANAIIAAMSEMTKYLASRPDAVEVMTRSMKMTRTELMAQMEGDPQAMAIAMRHGLTAREYNYGGPALRMALMASTASAGNGVIASLPTPRPHRCGR